MKNIILSSLLSLALVGMVGTSAKYSAKGLTKASVATGKVTGKATKATAKGLFWFVKNV